MARLGKGKPMDQQARAWLKKSLDLSSRHDAKTKAGIKGSRATGAIHSIATFNKYTTALKNAGEWARAVHGVRHLKDLTKEQARGYLEHRLDHGIGQKQLDADRNALQFVTGKLERVKTDKPVAKEPRAYTPRQVAMIQVRQTAKNALSTELTYRTGLRAHELLTLRRASESASSGHRTWHQDRFQGRDGVRYLVTGKGGLSREILVPRDLVTRLEACRRDRPKSVTDRGIRYESHYDIGGGNAWSRSFHVASKAALGRSNGGHGLRHSYAQERLDELQGRGHGYGDAKLILSQEMGHFRQDVVNAYLR